MNLYLICSPAAVLAFLLGSELTMEIETSRMFSPIKCGSWERAEGSKGGRGAPARLGYSIDFFLV